MVTVVEEVWKVIPEFPDYHISSFGRVYNDRRETLMRTSVNNHGHLKITLKSSDGPDRYTRSVAQLVAEAFVTPPNALCDEVVVLDGNFTNVKAENLVWRPRWFMWKYTHQLKTPQPVYYHNLRVLDITTGYRYRNIVEAGITEGLLFDDIWRSTYMQTKVFPTGGIFEVIDHAL